MSFANQSALITGASSGIGWSLAQELAATGCKVGLLARRGDLLKKLVDEITASGGAAWAVSADVADRCSVRSAVEALQQSLGPIDLLIANAGLGSPTPLDPFMAEEVEKVFQVNFFGVINVLEMVLPGMLARGTGHVVAISSLAAYRGLPGKQGYTSSKAAINSFMEGLRVQTRYRGIAVTTVCPGFIRTPMTEGEKFSLPWLMEPDVAARRILTAIRRKKKVYNFPWQTTFLMKLTRWLPDWLLARIFRRQGLM